MIAVASSALDAAARLGGAALSGATRLDESGTGDVLVLAAAAVTDNEYELRVASPGGGWRTFARLTLAATSGADALVSFDPVRNPVPGLDNYEWVPRLREPAYRRARHARGDAPEASAP